MFKKVIIIGIGVWVSGLVNVLFYNNYKIIMWGIDNKEINDINNGINFKYFGDKKFNNFNNVYVINNLEEVLNEFDLMILVVLLVVIDSVFD